MPDKPQTGTSAPPADDHTANHQAAANPATTIEVSEMDASELSASDLASLQRLQAQQADSTPANTPPSLNQRAQGALLGLACGDALGTTLEFQPPGTFQPIDDISGGGPFHLQPGEWTDDTAMAFCLGTSLVERGTFDPVDQMQRYLQWYRQGAYASNGRCFDIGNTVANALNQFEQRGEPFAGSADPQTAGNGSLMRLAPVALACAAKPRLAIHLAGDMSRTTHAAPEAIDACRFFASLLVGALQGLDKGTLLAADYSPVLGLWEEQPLSPRIQEIAHGSYWHKEPPQIIGSSYVVESLEAALWAFAKADSFRHGALLAVNLGDDADTTGAIYGQLAGAYFGVQGIPSDWRAKLARHDELAALADRLIALDADAMEQADAGQEATYDIDSLDTSSEGVPASWFKT